MRAQPSIPQTSAEEGNERAPWLAAGLLLGAALAFWGVSLAAERLGEPHLGLQAGVVLSALAAVLAVPPPTRVPGLLLAWNGLGLAVGLFVIGVFSVGALMAFPLLLLVLALGSWPSGPGSRLTMASLPAVIAEVGGLALAVLLSGAGVEAVHWLADVIGGGG